MRQQPTRSPSPGPAPTTPTGRRIAADTTPEVAAIVRRIEREARPRFVHVVMVEPIDGGPYIAGVYTRKVAADAHASRMRPTLEDGSEFVSVTRHQVRQKVR